MYAIKKSLFVLIASVGLMACAKNPPAPATTPTALQLTIVDINGSPVGGASVSLYSSYANYLDSSNSVGGGFLTTGLSGIVTFSNLSSQEYFFRAEKGAANNSTTGDRNAAPLESGKTTTLNVIIK